MNGITVSYFDYLAGAVEEIGECGAWGD